MDQDQQNLRLLSIFHYVVGGLIGLFACLPLVHLAFGIMIVSGKLPHNQNQPGMDAMVGTLLIAIASFCILAGWSMAIAVLLAGYWLAARRRYTYCLIVAGIECLFMPFGTVLGIFTIIVLLRPTVKQLFEHESGSPV
jgi:hypothetical protein